MTVLSSPKYGINSVFPRKLPRHMSWLKDNHRHHDSFSRAVHAMCAALHRFRPAPFIRHPPSARSSPSSVISSRQLISSSSLSSSLSHSFQAGESPRSLNRLGKALGRPFRLFRLTHLPSFCLRQTAHRAVGRFVPRSLNRRDSTLWRSLVSADLSSDETSATGSRQSFALAASGAKKSS